MAGRTTSVVRCELKRPTTRSARSSLARPGGMTIFLKRRGDENSFKVLHTRRQFFKVRLSRRLKIRRRTSRGYVFHICLVLQRQDDVASRLNKSQGRNDLKRSIR